MAIDSDVQDIQTLINIFAKNMYRFLLECGKVGEDEAKKIAKASSKKLGELLQQEGPRTRQQIVDDLVSTMESYKGDSRLANTVEISDSENFSEYFRVYEKYFKSPPMLVPTNIDPVEFAFIVHDEQLEAMKYLKLEVQLTTGQLLEKPLKDAQHVLKSINEENRIYVRDDLPYEKYIALRSMIAKAREEEGFPKFTLIPDFVKNEVTGETTVNLAFLSRTTGGGTKSSRESFAILPIIESFMAAVDMGIENAEEIDEEFLEKVADDAEIEKDNEEIIKEELVREKSKEWIERDVKRLELELRKIGEKIGDPDFNKKINEFLREGEQKDRLGHVSLQYEKYLTAEALEAKINEAIKNYEYLEEYCPEDYIKHGEIKDDLKKGLASELASGIKEIFEKEREEREVVVRAKITGIDEKGEPIYEIDGPEYLEIGKDVALKDFNTNEEKENSGVTKEKYEYDAVNHEDFDKEYSDATIAGNKEGRLRVFISENANKMNETFIHMPKKEFEERQRDGQLVIKTEEIKRFENERGLRQINEEALSGMRAIQDHVINKALKLKDELYVPKNQIEKNEVPTVDIAEFLKDSPEQFRDRAEEYLERKKEAVETLDDKEKQKETMKPMPESQLETGSPDFDMAQERAEKHRKDRITEYFERVAERYDEHGREVHGKFEHYNKSDIKIGDPEH